MLVGVVWAKLLDISAHPSDSFALIFSADSHKTIIDQFNKKICFTNSPTLGHLSVNVEQILAQFNPESPYSSNQQAKTYSSNNSLLQNLAVKRCLTSLYCKELEENTKGRYTFVHAQQWKWEWFSWLYKKLYETTQHISVTNYQFLRFNRIKNSNSHKETEIYTYLKNYGRGSDRTRLLRNRLLFLNAALFANTSELGSCSVEYWCHNDDNSHVRHNTSKITSRFIFNKFDLATLYDRYQKEIADLEREHALLTRRGNLILFSLAKPLVQSHVYMARNGGYKQYVAIKTDLTDDTPAFVQELKKNPTNLSETDKIEFCLILTKDRTLRPSPELTMFTFNDIEPAKWEKFCKKRDALFDRIKRDIETTKKKS